jgi:hypothetical protein
MRSIGSTVPSRITYAFFRTVVMGLFQRGREGGQQVDGLAYVAVGRGDPDAEARGKASVGVAAAQVGQDEQGLPAAGQATPA